VCKKATVQYLKLRGRGTQCLQAVAQVNASLLVLALGALANALKVQGISGRDPLTLRGGIARAALSRGSARGGVASAAVLDRWLGLAVRSLLANKCALGLLAISRAVALPVAKGLFANRLALGCRVGALGVANGLLADSVTLRAGTFLAVLHRAPNFALWLITLNLALGATDLLAASRALGLLAYRLADLIANGAVALPLALGVAVTLFRVTTLTITGGARCERNGNDYCEYKS
jgi:hypothetical protein